MNDDRGGDRDDRWVPTTSDRGNYVPIFGDPVYPPAAYGPDWSAYGPDWSAVPAVPSPMPLPQPPGPRRGPRGRRGLLIGVGAVLAVGLAGLLAHTVASSGPSAEPGPPSGVQALPPAPVPSGPPATTPRGTTGIPAAPGGVPSALPSGISICSGATNSLQAATTYVGAAEVGFGAFAQSCVYRGTVSIQVTQRLAGRLFAPQTTDVNAPVVTFESADGTETLRVSIAREPDGRLYVVGVDLR